MVEQALKRRQSSMLGKVTFTDGSSDEGRVDTDVVGCPSGGES